MPDRVLICFPAGDAPGLRAEAAQLALGLAARDVEVIAFGSLGPWRHSLRRAHIDACEVALDAPERKLAETLKEYDPHVVHAFGADAARIIFPHAMMAGAGAVATLWHHDLPKVTPTQFRTASAIFVPCEYLREQVARRLPGTSVVVTGYLLPPDAETPDMANRFLAENLGAADGAPLILLADTFHGSETDTAVALIEALPAVAQRFPDVQLVLAGDGSRLPDLERVAVEVNDRLGRRAVILPGRRDDIAELLALTTVAVGSGRFAMEAIGAGVACIVAGANGVIGTYTDDTAQMSHFSCCGRHGRLDTATPKALATEIIGLLMYDQHRARFAAEGRIAALERWERTARAGQITTYYERSAPGGPLTRTPARMTVLLPDDLRGLLFALPALAGASAHFPLLQLRAVTTKAHERLLKQMRAAESVLAKPADAREWLPFLHGLRHPRPDTCLVTTTDWASVALASVSGAAHRIGHVECSGSLLLSEHVRSRLPVSPARTQELVMAMGVPAEGKVTAPRIPPDVQEVVTLSLLSGGVDYAEPMILLCPEAEELRAWPMDQWEALARRLLEERPEKIAVLGGGEANFPEGVVPVAPVHDSLVLAALLARASVVVAGDTGALHLADVLGVPTVGLYGPTAPDAWRLPNAHAHPLCHREFPCHPCVDSPCAERHCLRALTPAEVAGAVHGAMTADVATRG